LVRAGEWREGGGVMRVTDTKTLASAMRALSAQIESDDGIANAAIFEAAQRIDDLSALAKEMAGMLAHDTALPAGFQACAMQKRLAELGVTA
jgi:hypothetical protein